MINKRDIEVIMQGVIDDILIPKFLSLGMNATGDWIAALEPRARGFTGEIWGLDYTKYLVEGRAPGSPPPVTPLVRWASAKFGASGNEALSIAFAVRHKIAQEGTSYWPQGTDLLEVLNSDQTKVYIQKKIVAILQEKARSRILSILKDE